MTKRNVKNWLNDMGDNFLRTCGVEIGNPPEPKRWRDEILEKCPQIKDILDKAYSYEVEGDHCFVHTGIRPGVPISQQKSRDLLYIEDEFLGYRGKFEKTVVHGHSWRKFRLPEVHENRIALNTFDHKKLAALAIVDGSATNIHLTRQMEGPDHEKLFVTDVNSVTDYKVTLKPVETAA